MGSNQIDGFRQAGYRSDRDDIKALPVHLDMRGNDLQSAKVWRTPADSVFG
jgi:hypothetical protein